MLSLIRQFRRAILLFPLRYSSEQVFKTQTSNFPLQTLSALCHLTILDPSQDFHVCYKVSKARLKCLLETSLVACPDTVWSSKPNVLSNAEYLASFTKWYPKAHLLQSMWRLSKLIGPSTLAPVLLGTSSLGLLAPLHQKWRGLRKPYSELEAIDFASVSEFSNHIQCHFHVLYVYWFNWCRSIVSGPILKKIHTTGRWSPSRISLKPTPENQGWNQIVWTLWWSTYLLLSGDYQNFCRKYSAQIVAHWPVQFQKCSI